MSLDMLVDARNVLYRAIYAVKTDRRAGKYHYYTAMLRQMVTWMNMYRPSAVHVFWDAPRATVWRRSALPTYKDRPKTNTEDISEDLNHTTEIAQEFFSYMNVRQYSKKTMEADDLIYAATSVLHPNPTLIISSDSDMIQIPYSYNSCKIYNPGKKEETEIPTINPVWQKALTGDNTDCINGYYGIGPKKSAELMRNRVGLQDFLKIKGAEIFNRNLLLIDLSLCPRMLANRLYVHKKLAEPTMFDNKEINKLIMKYKVNGLMQEFNDLFMPFKRLTEYEEPTDN